MITTNRRQFLQQTGALVAGTATLGFANSTHAAGANEKVLIWLVMPVNTFMWRNRAATTFAKDG